MTLGWVRVAAEGRVGNLEGWLTRLLPICVFRGCALSFSHAGIGFSAGGRRVVCVGVGLLLSGSLQRRALFQRPQVRPGTLALLASRQVKPRK